MTGQELFGLFALNARSAGAKPAHEKDIARHRDSAQVHWYQLSEELKAAWERTATQLNEIGGHRMIEFRKAAETAHGEQSCIDFTQPAAS